MYKKKLINFNRQSESLVPNLLEDEIHVWLINITKCLFEYRFISSILSKDELSHVNNFKHKKDKISFLSRRYALRKILSLYLDADPKKISFNVNENQKPFIEVSINNGKFSFNLSHSDSLAVLAVCRDNNVGVDVEKINAFVSIDGFEKLFFSDKEILSVNVDGRFKVNEFYKVWTRKEALLKAVGVGLNYNDLRAVCTVNDEYVWGGGNNYRMESVEVAKGYFCSIAFEDDLKKHGDV
jgi:4'-phosphopantetheinyl transferase